MGVPHNKTSISVLYIEQFFLPLKDQPCERQMVSESCSEGVHLKLKISGKLVACILLS